MDVIGLVKKDHLLVISAVLAIISLLLVPFDTVKTYNYERILETISILLIFLLIVAGLRECNALNKLAHRAVTNIETTRALCLALILLPFFCAMLFSNDVALLTFVPLAITMLTLGGLKRIMVIVVVLQTVAANVGSFLTPFGNPHNLFIFNHSSYYGFTLFEYESVLIPIVVVGAIVMIAIAMMIKNQPLTAELDEDVELKDRKVLIAIMVLFVLAIASVVDIIPYYIVLVIIIVAFLIMMREVFTKVNYSILFIFFFLFLFANGLTKMDGIYDIIMKLMDWDPMLTTVLVSQFTSNVPSTILLQPFTEPFSHDWAAILVGADIGGFGTPIASMASIITMKFYLQEEGSSVKRFLKMFIPVNLIMIVVLVPTYYVFCT